MTCVNLRSEMRRSDVTVRCIADLVGASESAVSSKIDEVLPFTVDEALAIRDGLFPGMRIGYLFASDGIKPSKESRAIARVDAVADAMLEGCEDDPETVEIARELRETAACVDPDRVLKILG